MNTPTNMNKINNKQLLRNLVKLLPNNINESSEHLISNQLINEPIINLKQTVSQYVIDEIITKIDYIVDHNCSFDYDKYELICLHCEAIIDIVWENINCCQWDQVVIDLRYCFGYISLIKCLLKIYVLVVSNRNNNSFHNKLLALNALDFGLLMSPSFWDNVLAKFATAIHKSIVDQQRNEQLDGTDGTLESNDVPKRKISGNETNNSSVKRFHKEEELDENDLNISKTIPYYNGSSDKRSIIRVSNLDLDQFRDQYLIRKVPVIITHCMADWPSISSRKWTVDYILKVAAFRTVPIEIGSKYTDEEWSQKLMTIKEFVNQYILNENSKQIGYLAQHNLFEQIEELRADFSLPDYCCITEEDINVDINAWFGPKHTVSPLHFDPKDNLLAQVMGSKYIRLYSDQTPEEFIYPNQCRLLCNTSRVDLENVNELEFPLFNKIDNYYECILKEGEMLFIPKKYWHFVKSLSTSFSISFWWK